MQELRSERVRRVRQQLIVLAASFFGNLHARLTKPGVTLYDHGAAMLGEYGPGLASAHECLSCCRFDGHQD
ncbi:hypothetical protein ACVIHH_008270 [Bradyrhizobium sp. USDA 4518]